MLSKDNIVLRAPEPQDVEFLYQLENDPDFWHLSNTNMPFSRFDLEQYVLLSDKDVFKTRQARFIIELSEANQKKTIGAVGNELTKTICKKVLHQKPHELINSEPNIAPQNDGRGTTRRGRGLKTDLYK